MAGEKVGKYKSRGKIYKMQAGNKCAVSSNRILLIGKYSESLEFKHVASREMQEIGKQLGLIHCKLLTGKIPTTWHQRVYRGKAAQLSLLLKARRTNGVKTNVVKRLLGITTDPSRLSTNFFYNFEEATSFLGPMNPKRYPAILRIWISSLPSVIRYLL